MTTVNVTPRQWVNWMTWLGKAYWPAVDRGVLAGAWRCVPLMHTRTAQAPPASKYGRIGAFNTGSYRQAWRASKIPDGARIQNLKPYAGVIEYGRRPHGVSEEGKKNLQMWVKRKIGVKNPEEIVRIAELIARWQGRHPLRPRHVMTGALEDMARLVSEEILHELWVEFQKP